MASRNTIIIDILVRGLERVQNIARILIATFNNSAVQRGFQQLIQRLNQTGNRFGALISDIVQFGNVLKRVATTGPFQQFADKLRTSLGLLKNEFKGVGGASTTAQGKMSGFFSKSREAALLIGALSIQLRSLGFLIRDTALNFLRFSQRVFAAFKNIIAGGGEVERSMSELAAIIGEVSKETNTFRELSSTIVELGERTSFTIAQVTLLGTELAKAGFSGQEIATSLAGVVALAEAGGLQPDKAAEIVANTLRAFGLVASETNRVVDTLTATALNSNQTIEQLGESFSYVATTAKTFGFSIEEVAATLGVLANAGIKSSVSGSGLQQVIVQLTTHADKAAEVLERYGSSYSAIDPNIRSLTEIIAEFERINISATDTLEIFTTRALRSFNALKNQGAGSISTLEGMAKAADGFAKAVAAMRLDNVPGEMLKLKSAIESLKFAVLKELSEDISSVVRWMTELVLVAKDWVSDNPERVKAFAQLIAKTAAWSAAISGGLFVLSGLTRVLATVLGFVNVLQVAVESVTLFMGPLFTSIGTVIKPLLGLGAAGTSAGAALTVIGGKIAAFFTATLPLVAAVAAIVSAAMIALIPVFKAVKANLEGFKGVIMAVWKNLKAFFVGVVIGFKATFSEFLQGILNSSLGVFLKNLEGLLGNLTGAGKAFGVVVGSLIGLVADLAIVFVGAVVEIANFFVWVQRFTSTALLLIPGYAAFASGVKEANEEVMKITASMNDFHDALVETSEEAERLEKVGKIAAQAASFFKDLKPTNPNTLKQIKEMLESAEALGVAFDSISVNQELVQQTKVLREAEAQLERAKENLKTIKGSVSEAEEEQARRAVALAQESVRSIEDSISATKDLRSVVTGFDKIKTFGSFEDLQAEIKAIEERLVEGTKKMNVLRHAITRTTNEADEKAAREALKDQNEILEELNKQRVLLGQVTGEEHLVAIQNSKDVSDAYTRLFPELQKQIQARLDEEEAEAKLAETRKEAHEERLKQLKEIRDERRFEGLEGAELALAKEQALHEERIKIIDEEREHLERLRNERMSGLQTIHGYLQAVAMLNADEKNEAERNAKVKAKIDEEVNNKRITATESAALEAATIQKDVNKVLALEQKKFQRETENIIKESNLTQQQEQQFRVDRSIALQDKLAQVTEKFADKSNKASVKQVESGKKIADATSQAASNLIKQARTLGDIVRLQSLLIQLEKSRANFAEKAGLRALAATRARVSLENKIKDKTAAGTLSNSDLNALDRARLKESVRRNAASSANSAAGFEDRLNLADFQRPDVKQIDNIVARIQAKLAALDQIFSAAPIRWFTAFVASFEGNKNLILESVDRLMEEIQNKMKMGLDFSKLSGIINGVGNGVNFNPASGILNGASPAAVGDVLNDQRVLNMQVNTAVDRDEMLRVLNNEFLRRGFEV